MHLKDLTEFQLSGKRVLLRADMNVPLRDGKITSTERIDRSLPTIKHILEEGGSIILISHLGRPEETGKVQQEFSLRPVVSYLEEKLQIPIPLTESLDSLRALKGSFTVLENIRFFKGEKGNDSDLAKKLGSLCDIFVLDAFAASHREHASTTGVTGFVNQACIGFLIREELEALETTEKANSPILAVLGGAKISSKLSLINALAKKVDHLLLGGGIANTCLGSKGLEIGASLVEPSLYSEARNLAEKDNVLLPDTVLVAPNKDCEPRVASVESLKKDECIFDISILYVNSIKKTFEEAKTIIWNGPMGFFEEDRFSLGTKAVAELISESDAYTVIGGGDTIAAAAQANVLDSIDYVSTAGGAFLNYLEGKPLPALVAIEEKSLES